MIGIYKIINPNGRVYIGQSINIFNRKIQYKNYIGNSSSIGPKLLNSFQKYGYNNHKFEIIEECSIELLNERETFWKIYHLEQFNNDWKQVLFCELYDNGGGPRSKETKQKQSISHQNNLLRPEILEKRLINCKKSSTEESKTKRNNNINWEERNKKLCKPRTYYKEINKLDLNNNIIKTFYNIKDILDEFNNPRPQNLYSCLKGKYKTWMGFKWEGIKI